MIDLVYDENYISGIFYASRYPANTRVCGGNLVLRHSAPLFMSNEL